VLNIIVPVFDLDRSFGNVRYGKDPEKVFNVWKFILKIAYETSITHTALLNSSLALL